MIRQERTARQYLVALQARFTPSELERVTAEAERVATTVQARVVTRLHVAAALQRIFPGR